MHKNFFTLCCFLSLLDSWQVGIINLYNFVMEVMHMESDVKISVAHNEIEFAEIAALADEIWHEHYKGLLSDEQIDYMVEKFQSQKAITKSVLENNYTYYIMRDAGQIIGYCGVQPQPEDNSLFLSKLYLHKDYRGKHLSRMVMAMLCERCVTEDLDSIWLTVNRGNTDSIQVYRRLGFSVEREQKENIGNGYFMDDYVMRYLLPSPTIQ